MLIRGLILLALLTAIIMIVVPREDTPEPVYYPYPEDMIDVIITPSEATEAPYSDLTTVEVTSYCLQGTMSNGEQVHNGSVACPRDIELGTKVVLGGSEYECSDRTSIGNDGVYDIWMSDCSDSITFGRKQLLVEVL